MPHLVRRRLRAPQEDGAALVDPPLADAPALIERNRAIGAAFDRLGWFDLNYRTAARKALWQSCLPGDVRQVGDVCKQPFILAGHQPELFHPGVWLKHFAIASLARASGGAAVNLIIDNDLCRFAGIHVPSQRGGLPEIAFVAFDAAAEPIPWEQRPLLDEHAFAGFAGAVRRTFESFSASARYRGPMILERLWPHAANLAQWQSHPPDDSGSGVSNPPRERSGGEGQLAWCLTGARRAFEQELGLHNAECALSSIASGEAFVAFSAYLFARHRELHTVYNAALAEFRLANGVRSRSHPVPDLVQEADWYEMPFWIWTADKPRRRRVFVRQTGNSWEITDREGIAVRARPSDAPAMTRFAALLIGRGIRLRPRALITTMYARLVLSDLFIHGIGGAKYDELTDLIIRRFFGIEPPAYVTATATFRLPIERPEVSLDDMRRSARRIRELRYQPEAFLRDPRVRNDASIRQQLEPLAAEKREHLDRHDLRRCPPEVFEQLDRINRAMYELLRPVEAELRAEHAQLQEQLKQSQLLASREFSFCLFPSEILPARLLDLCKLSS